MSTLDKLRAALPWASDLDDAEILGEVSKRTHIPVQDVASAFGIETGANKGAIRAGLSSGIDQIQGLGYSALGGAADAVGANPVRDWANRRAAANQVEGELSGRPDLERIEDQSWSTAGPFAAYQIAKQVPTMGAILGAEMIPGVGQIAGASGLARMGAVAPRFIGGGGLRAGADFAARRAALAQGEALASESIVGAGLGYGSLYGESVEGGDPSPYASAALAIPYGLSEAAVPASVRGAFRTGSELTGNMATRMLKAGGLASLGEAGTETLQNEMEMGMRNDLTPEQIRSRRINSAVVGGLVGGHLGALGGIPGGRTVDDGAYDLTQPGGQKEVRQLGYSPLAGTPIVFPDGSVALNSEQELLARYGQGMPAAQIPGAEEDVVNTQQTTTPVSTAVFDETDRALMDRGVKPNKMRKDLFNELKASGLDPESESLSVFWTEMAQGRNAKAKNALAEAIIAAKKEQANGTQSAPVAPVGAGSVGASPVDQGSVVAGGPVAAVNGAGGGAAIDTGAATSQVAPVGDTGLQPAAPVSVVNTQQQGKADPFQVTSQQEEGDGYVDDEDAWNDFKPDNGPEYKALTPGHKQTWAELRKMGKLSGAYAEEMSNEYSGQDNADDIRSTIKQIFGARDAAIVESKFVDGMTDAQIAEKHGVGRSRVSQMVGDGAVAKKFRDTKIKAAQEANGWSDEYVQSLMGQLNKAAPGEVVADTSATGGMTDTQIEDENAGASAEDMSLSEAGMGTISSGGGSTINYTDDVKDENLSKLKPREHAAAMAQRAIEAREKADELMQRVRDAQAAGKDTLANHQGKQSLEEAVAEYKELRRAVRKSLDEAKESLAKISRVSSETLAEESKQSAQEEAVDEELSTDEQKAGKAWDKVADEYPNAPKWSELTAEQRNDFLEYGEENWTPDDVRTELAKLDKKFGKDGAVKNHYTAAELKKEISGFIRADIQGRKLMIVDSVGELMNGHDPEVRAVGAALAVEGAYGVAANGRGYLVANRIEKGKGRAKFMHEVGAHLGLEALLPQKLYDRLTQQLVDWAKKDDGSVESELALNAVERVKDANTPKEDRRAEILAYFLEEAVQAGIDPTAYTKGGQLGQWFRSLWAAFKIAVRKLGMKPEALTAQDIVDMAYGAARLEMAGTYHGTAAEFRKFNHKYMGTGEGAQAFGWGTYLAQRFGIAKGYWEADINRKSSGTAGRRVQDYLRPGSETAKSLAALGEKLKSLPAGEFAHNKAPKVRSLLGMVAGVRFDRNYHQYLVDAVHNEVYFNELSPAEAVDKILNGSKKDGAVMRVDVGVDQNEMLDWYKRLAEQPEIAQKIRDNMPKELIEQLQDEVGQSLFDMDGNDFYSGLKFLEDRDGRVGEEFSPEDYNSRLRGKKPNEMVSKYLDEKLGIPGIKFSDAMSRNQASRNFFNSPQRDEIGNAFEELDAEKAVDNGIIGIDQFIDQIESTKDTAGFERLTKSLGLDPSYAKVFEDYVAWKKQPAPEGTRNLVVFNDKNIFRVGSRVGNKRENMKFGKEANVTPKAAQQSVSNLTRVLKTVGSKALNTAMFSQDLFKRAADMGITAAKDLGSLYQKRAALTGEIERKVIRIEQMFNRIPDAQRQEANQFVRDMRFAKKWGFVPDWRSGSVEVDQDLQKRFDELPKEAQAWAQALFKHGDEMRTMKQDAVRNAFNSVYDARIADAKKANDADKVTALEKEKDAELSRFKRLFAADERNPYAPVRRFGNWVVVGKSNEYLDAEEAGDKAKMAKLEADADHYFVDFRENYGEALKLSQDLEASGLVATEPREKEDARNDMYGGLMQAFDKLRGNIDSEIGNTTDANEKKALTAAREVVVDLYLRSLADTSARKSELRFKGVAGDIDMLRSFSSQGRADAHFLAAATYNPQMTEAITKMRQQKKSPGNATEKSMAFNEIMARHEQSMKYKEGGWFDTANKATAVTSAWMLATSPMYYLQNLTQPAVISVPYMTGKHEYSAVWGQLLRAYHQMGPLLKSAKVGEGFDFSKVPEDVRDAVLELVNRGRIDIGMDTELGKVKLEGDTLASKVANRTSQFFRTLAQKAEAINRVSTAMAAYRLELKRTGDAAKALEYADEVLDKTHGDYTAANAPRLFNTPAGKVALQFRKFQLIQLTLLAKMTHDAFKGASPKERAAARKMLAFTLGHTGTLAGVVGMPGFAAASFIVNHLADLFGDDDEPYNLENELRKALGDGDFARVVMRGAPMVAGMDLSSKVGMGTALSILPYSDMDMTRAGFNEMATGLTLGATGGLGARVWEALGNIKDGDYYRGLAGLMPKGLADAYRAFHEASDGMTRKNGDTLLSADEIGTFDTIAKAIGLTTAKESERKFDQGVVYDNKQAFEKRTTQLKSQYVQARRNGDAEGAQAAMQGWRKLQQSRREAGMDAQPMSTLLKAPQEQMKRDRNVSGGVQYDKHSRRMVLAQTSD